MEKLKCPKCNETLVNNLNTEIVNISFPPSRYDVEGIEVPFFLIGCQNCGHLLHISKRS